MSRIDTLTSKEQAVEEVPQEMLVIGAFHLAKEQSGLNAENDDQFEFELEGRDWNEVIKGLFLSTEQVLTADYLLAGEKNLQMSEIVDAPGKDGMVYFLISASQRPEKTLLSVYMPITAR